MATVGEVAASGAVASYWVDQVSAAANDVTTSTTTAAAAAWAGFTAWYDAQLVAEQAAATADLSLTAQAAVAGAFTEYVAQVTAAMRGTRLVVPSVPTPQVRNGADLVRVHSRPAEVFRVTFSETADEILAAQRAQERALAIVDADIMLAARQAQLETMEELEVQRYRRVLRPELSESGPCGLCVVASDQIYTIGDLLPLHDRCKCITLPIVGSNDPGLRLNKTDLKRIYAAAGDTTDGRELKRVRVQINEHGELGPVLTVHGHKFKGPEDLGRRDPEQNRSDLKKLLGVLDQLTTRAADGEDLADPLAYQRKRIARLDRAA